MRDGVRNILNKRVIIALLCAIVLLLPTRVFAQTTTDAYDEYDGSVYTVKLEDGSTLFTVAANVSEGDEYISADNKRYKINIVNREDSTATATFDGVEELPSVEWLKSAFAVTTAAKAAGERKIAIYCTHTDESYIPSDGTESNDNGGGIIDVAESLKASLEKQGVTVAFDDSNHLPHDGGAYKRSRETAVSLMKAMPDALLDVHRDGIPDPDEYITTVDGEEVTKVRLLVGRSNANSASNKEFAKQIKAIADEQYPGLIKDIFIGKGSYNQDLSPQSVLLEFGTHTTSKERAERSTGMIATSITTALYGSGSAAGGTAKTNSGVGKGIWIVVIFAILAAIVYAFVATGSGRGMMNKLARNTSEITGGLIGKKPEDDRRER